MQKKKLVLGLASVALVATLAVGGTLAYFSDSDAKSNVFTLGKVDISLQEDYELDDTEDEKATYVEDEDGNITGIEYDDVVPGDDLIKDVTVVVAEDSRDAYIAVRISFTGLDDVEELPELNIVDGWTYDEENDLYIYDEIVSAEDVINVFDTVSIPTTWGNEFAEAEFGIEITAYAVQAENLEAEEAAAELVKLAE